jgi:uncharacterized protein
VKFIVTAELGRLCTWLRILGFDTVLEKNKPGLVIKSLRDGRVILTRDSKMSRFTGTRIVRVKSDFVEEQVDQVIKELGLKIDRSGLFKLCVLCNAVLEEADRESARGRVPGYVFESQQSFMRCPKCGKLYWQGTHWALVNRFLERLSL